MTLERPQIDKPDGDVPFELGNPPVSLSRLVDSSEALEIHLKQCPVQAQVVITERRSDLAQLDLPAQTV